MDADRRGAAADRLGGAAWGQAGENSRVFRPIRRHPGCQNRNNRDNGTVDEWV